MPVSCEFYVEQDGRCAWCMLTLDDHRFRPCKQCGGWGHLPDPADRRSRKASLPTWAWNQIPCACTLVEGTRTRTTGWIDRTTQQPADNHTVETYR